MTTVIEVETEVAMERDVYHDGKLITTEIGPMFACRRCQLLLDAAGWAKDCPGVSQARRVTPAIAAVEAGKWDEA